PAGAPTDRRRTLPRTRNLGSPPVDRQGPLGRAREGGIPMNTPRAFSAWTAHLPRDRHPAWLSDRPALTPPYRGGARGRKVPLHDDEESTRGPLFPPLDQGSPRLFPPLDKGGSGGVLSRGLARLHHSSVTCSNRGTIVAIALAGWLLVGAQQVATAQ